MVKCLSVELDWISHEYNRIRETLEFLFYSVFSQGNFLKVIEILNFIQQVHRYQSVGIYIFTSLGTQRCQVTESYSRRLPALQRFLSGNAILSIKVDPISKPS